MRFIRFLIGKIIQGIAKAHSFLLGGLISIIETGVLWAKSFLRGCMALMTMGGCLVIFLIIGPLSGFLLRNPLALLLFLIFISLPIVGTLLIPSLKYFRSVSTQYLMNLSLFLQKPQQHPYRPYRHFRRAYERAQEEAAHRERARRDQQRRAWEERFRQWHQYQQHGHGGPYQQSRQTWTNPYEDFRQKYQNSCKRLDLPPDTTDPNKIKLAYRRKAKTYHPDINKSPDATQRFQEISEAYEFLNEDNIERFRNLRR